MKNLYGSIKINKIIQEGGSNICRQINYYKLKNEKYGIEIVKEDDVNENIEITNIHNITESENQIDSILKILVDNAITPDSADVIEDLVKQYT